MVAVFQSIVITKSEANAKIVVSAGWTKGAMKKMVPIQGARMSGVVQKSILGTGRRAVEPTLEDN